MRLCVHTHASGRIWDVFRRLIETLGSLKKSRCVRVYTRKFLLFFWKTNTTLLLDTWPYLTSPLHSTPNLFSPNLSSPNLSIVLWYHPNHEARTTSPHNPNNRKKEMKRLQLSMKFWLALSWQSTGLKIWWKYVVPRQKVLRKQQHWMKKEEISRPVRASWLDWR